MYDLTFGQNDHFSGKNQPKEPCGFHTPCLQPKWTSFWSMQTFNQVEPFEKSYFLYVVQNNET